jgi:hypothetical protein
MALTISIPFGVETHDKAIYLRPGAAQVVLPPPDPTMIREIGSGAAEGSGGTPGADEVKAKEQELFSQ